MNLALFPLSCCEPRICGLSKQIIRPVPCEKVALSSVSMNSAEAENQNEEEFVPINDCFSFF